MKKLLGIVVLGLLLSGNAYADDIKDFQIEGMSLGDSALKYYSEDEIIANKQNWYNGKKYSTSDMGGIQISYKTKDKEYILEGIDLVETMDISKCSENISSEVDAIKDLFSDKVKLRGPERVKHWADKSKKSWFDQYIFKFPNKDYIFVECYNWTDKITSTKGWSDNFRVRIVSKGFLRFLNNQ